MSTSKVALRTVEQFMSDYKPVYNPIYSLFLGKAQSYASEAGKLEFRRVNTVGDIRGKHLTPKDSEIRLVSFNESKKTFKKYFLANQFQISQMQDQQGAEEIVSQVLDEHQKQMDELFLLGEGTSASTMLNNGLFWSADGNYVLESSHEVDTDADPLIGLHAKVMEKAQDADQVDGRKVIIFYGSDVIAKYNSVYASSPSSFKRVLADVLGSNYSLAKLPSAICPSGANGFIIANLDQVKLHYCSLPSLHSNGSNDEKMYNWWNFKMGSSMLEVLASGAIIRQPITFEA